MKYENYKCPICDCMTKMKRGYFNHKPKIGGRPRSYYAVKIHCDKCGYRFKSSGGLSQENFIFLTLYLEFNEADDPFWSEVTKALENHTRLRRKVLKEIRMLWSIRDSRLIMECLLSPNAQKDALKKKLSQWIVQNKKVFPILSFYASGEPNDEGQEDKGRGQGKKHPPRDGDEQNGAGSGK